MRKFTSILVGFLVLTSTCLGFDVVTNENGGEIHLDINRRDLAPYRKTFKPLLDQMAEIYLYNLDQELSQHAKLEAKLIKYHIIKGEIAKARNYAQTLLLSHHRQRIILERYLSYLFYLEGKYQKSYEILNSEVFAGRMNFSHICLMKTMLEIILDVNGLKNTWAICKLEGGISNVIGDISWLDILVELKSTKDMAVIVKIFRNLNIMVLSNDYLKFYLKLALYLDQDRFLISKVQKLDFSAYEDEETREIISIIFFRNNRLQEAWKLFQNINTANVENMKGILYQLSGKNELAYAQFQLAIKKKSNSFNGLKRALPLSILLDQSLDGLDLVKKIAKHEHNEHQARALDAYFKIKLNKNPQALKNLLQLYHDRTASSEIEINSMIGYSSIVVNDKTLALKFNRKACFEGDFMSCWILVQMDLWDDFPLVIRRDEPLHEKVVDYEIFKSGEEFKDIIYINQKDIDELDDNLIKLSKAP